MNTKINLFKFLGKPVKLDISFLFLFLFLSVELVLMVFLSVLIHELSHTWVANKRGYNVYGVQIGLLSGSASIDSNMQERDSLLVTAAGPLSNLILYLFATSLLFIIGDISFIRNFALINIFLFLFNILPIVPMDGGYILRDSLLVLKISRSKSYKISSIISLLTSILLLIISLYLEFFIISIMSVLFIYTSYKSIK